MGALKITFVAVAGIAAIDRIKTLEKRVTSQAGEIETLKSGRQQDHEALETLAAAMDANTQGGARLFGNVLGRLGNVERVAEESKRSIALRLYS